MRSGISQFCAISVRDVADILTKKERSRRMSLIRGFGNASTELRLLRTLKNAGITGWRRHLPLPGRPDFAFRSVKFAIFVDGDFWHGSPNTKLPSSNREFWLAKISANQARDRRVNAELKSMGWRVLRIWETDLKKQPLSIVKKIKRRLMPKK
jgi:DNA mismatch endonuclease (patch repair protein)